MTIRGLSGPDGGMHAPGELLRVGNHERGGVHPLARVDLLSVAGEVVLSRC
jgi:hypothetical protein